MYSKRAALYPHSYTITLLEQLKLKNSMTKANIKIPISDASKIISH